MAIDTNGANLQLHTSQDTQRQTIIQSQLPGQQATIRFQPSQSTSNGAFLSLVQQQQQQQPRQIPQPSSNRVFVTQPRPSFSGSSFVRQQEQQQQRLPQTSSFGSSSRQRPVVNQQTTFFGNPPQQQQPQQTAAATRNVLATNRATAPQQSENPFDSSFFDNRRPSNRQNPSIFDGTFPGPPSRLSPLHQTRPRLPDIDTGDNGGGSRRPSLNNENTRRPGDDFSLPSPPFFGPPPFDNRPIFEDEEFFESGFPRAPQRPQTRPQQQLPQPLPQSFPIPPFPRPIQTSSPRPQPIGTNFIIRPEDNRLKDIRFPGPPQSAGITAGAGRPSGTSRDSPNQFNISPQRPRPSSQQQQGQTVFQPPGFLSSQAARPERPQSVFRPSISQAQQQHGLGQFSPQFPQQSQEEIPSSFRPPAPRPPQFVPLTFSLPPSSQRLPDLVPVEPSSQNQPEVSEGEQQNQDVPTKTQSPQEPFHHTQTQPPTTPPPPPPQPQLHHLGHTTPVSISEQGRDPTRIPSTRGHHRFESSQSILDRPQQQTTHSPPSVPPRGRQRFRLQQDTDDGVSGQVVRRPSSVPADTEILGIPPPTDEFGTKLTGAPIDDRDDERFETVVQTTPQSRPSFHSLSPSTRRPSSSSSFFPEQTPSSPARQQSFRPQSHEVFSTAPPSSSLSQQFAPVQRHPGFSQDELPSRGVQGSRDQVFRFHELSTDNPADDFLPPTTGHRFSDTDRPLPVREDNRPQFSPQSSRDTFEELDDFSHGSGGDASGSFRGPFRHHQTLHPDQPSSDISSTSTLTPQPANLGPFTRPPQARPVQFNDQGAQFEPSFRPQSNDQLSPPELPSFTSKPDEETIHPSSDSSRSTGTGGQIPGESLDDSVFQGDFVQPHRHQFDNLDVHTTTVRATTTTSEELSTTPPEPTLATETGLPQRGRRPIGATGKRRLRTRLPGGIRSRTRQTTTTTPATTTEVVTEPPTTPKPARRMRPIGDTRRRRPISQQTAPRTRTSTEAPSANKPVQRGTADLTVSSRRPATSEGRRNVVRRLQSPRVNSTRTVVRRRRPTTTTLPSTDGTVDHSSLHSRDHLLSSDSINRKVAIISKLDDINDSAISASHEKFTVSKPDVTSSSDSLIQDHNSVTSSPEVGVEESHATKLTMSSEVDIGTTSNSDNEPTATVSWFDDISSPSITTTTIATPTSSKSTTTTAAPSDSKSEAMKKLRILLNRKFVIKSTTEAPATS